VNCRARQELKTKICDLGVRQNNPSVIGKARRVIADPDKARLFEFREAVSAPKAPQPSPYRISARLNCLDPPISILRRSHQNRSGVSITANTNNDFRMWLKAVWVCDLIANAAFKRLIAQFVQIDAI